jgi:parvulin-like peptidyl-prolyl isomerase
MHRFRFTVVLVALAATTAFASKPVLRVNGDVITDVEVKMAERAVAAHMQGTAPDDPALLHRTVEQLIDRTLILQAARDAKVTVDPKEVAASIEQQRQQLGGAEAFGKALAQAGVTEEELTRMEQQRMMLQRYVEQELLGKTGASEQEVRAYYDGHLDQFKHPEQLKLRAIMVAVKQGADQAEKDGAKARAEQALKRIQGGEDFGKVAQEMSEDPGKVRGGEIGWVRKGLLLQELETPVWALKSGEVSQVLESQRGYHIFKVEDRRSEGISSYDEVKDSLATFVKNRKLDDSLQLLIAARRSKAKIEALDPAIKAALETPSGPTAAKEAPAPGTKSVPAAAPSPAHKPTADAPKQQ